MAAFSVADVLIAAAAISPSSSNVMRTICAFQPIARVITNQVDRAHTLAAIYLFAEAKVRLLANAGEDDGYNTRRAIMAEIASGLFPAFIQVPSFDTAVFTIDLRGNAVARLFPTNNLAMNGHDLARLQAAIGRRATAEGLHLLVQPLFDLAICLSKLGSGAASWATKQARIMRSDFPEIDLMGIKERQKTFDMFSNLLKARQNHLVTVSQALPRNQNNPIQGEAEGLLTFQDEFQVSLNNLQIAVTSLSPRVGDTVSRAKGMGFTSLQLVADTVRGTNHVVPWALIFADPEMNQELMYYRHSKNQFELDIFSPFVGQAGYGRQMSKLVYFCKELQTKVLGSVSWMSYAGGEPGGKKALLDAHVRWAVAAVAITVPQVAPLVAPLTDGALLEFILN